MNHYILLENKHYVHLLKYIRVQRFFLARRRDPGKHLTYFVLDYLAGLYPAS